LKITDRDFFQIKEGDWTPEEGIYFYTLIPHILFSKPFITIEGKKMISNVYTVARGILKVYVCAFMLYDVNNQILTDIMTI
jgi:hypothetical protein